MGLDVESRFTEAAFRREQEPKTASRCVGSHLVDVAAQVPGFAEASLSDLLHSSDDGSRLFIGEAGQEVLHGASARGGSIVAPLAPMPVLDVSHEQHPR